jgi:hypothetical protein
LLLTPKAPEDIPRLITALGGRLVQYINKTYRRTPRPYPMHWLRCLMMLSGRMLDELTGHRALIWPVDARCV